MEEKSFIRCATEADAATLLAIYEPYVRDTAITFEWEVPTVEEFRDRIRDKLTTYPYLVAERGGQIIGYAYASRYRSRKAYDWAAETSIYIRKDCRGTGAGSLLLAELERLLQKQGVLNLYACITSLEEQDLPDPHWTDQSIVFHQKKGYLKAGYLKKCGFKFNRWYDLALYEKMLGDHTSQPAPVTPCNPDWISQDRT